MTDLTNFDNPDSFAQYLQKPVSHAHVAFPAIMRELGDIDKKRVLDIGCGPGDFSAELVKAGAQVHDIDTSWRCYEHCRNRFRENSAIFQVMDGADMMTYIDNIFDHAVANMVLINVEDPKTVRGIFKETARVLRPEGSFIFTDVHPLAKMMPNVLTQSLSFLPGGSYFQNQSRYDSVVRMADGSTMPIRDMHWTLEFLTDSLAEAGLHIHRITEPQPIEGAPKELQPYDVPEYILYHCKKQ